MADTKELLHIVEDIQQAQEAQNIKSQANFTGLYEAIENLPIDGDIAKPLLTLLALPLEQFKLIAPLILLDINKNLHDSNTQLLIAQTCNAKNLTTADLTQLVEELKTELDSINLEAEKKDFIKQIFMDLNNALSEIQGIPKRVIEVPIEICNANAQIPNYAHLTDSGMDIYAIEDITIAPGETIIVPTGLKVAIPVGYELQVRPKSGRSLKTKLRIANTPGTIDAGYRDEIGVIIDNIDAPIKKLYMNDNGTIAGIDHGSSYTIGKGEKFAQLVLCQVAHCAFTQIESVGAIENDGRNGGFGSTGLK